TRPSLPTVSRSTSSRESLLRGLERNATSFWQRGFSPTCPSATRFSTEESAHSTTNQDHIMKLISLKGFTGTIALALTMCLLSGCNKRYNSIINPNEGIRKNSLVTLDGQRAGEVKKVQVQDGQLVAEFDVDRSVE